MLIFHPIHGIQSSTSSWILVEMSDKVDLKKMQFCFNLKISLSTMIAIDSVSMGIGEEGGIGKTGASISVIDTLL